VHLQGCVKRGVIHNSTVIKPDRNRFNHDGITILGLPKTFLKFARIMLTFFSKLREKKESKHLFEKNLKEFGDLKRKSKFLTKQRMQLLGVGMSPLTSLHSKDLSGFFAQGHILMKLSRRIESREEFLGKLVRQVSRNEITRSSNSSSRYTW